jgi:glycosyltransferase involved in cell wall biosynthesis
MSDVSIITCTYNQDPRLLRECAESVKGQTEANRWIVVDDGSSAPCHRDLVTILQEHFSGDSVSLLTMPLNQGLSAARNAALDRVETEWTIVLDSDDRLAPSIVQEVGRLPRNMALACFEVDYFDDHSSQHRSIRRFETLYKKHGRSELDPFLWFDFYYHGIIARTSLLRAIGGFISALSVGEDQDILLRATEQIPVEAVAFVNKRGYQYRANPNGVCALRWAEVERNYCRTMLAAANRRGAEFSMCRHAGSRRIEGADIDHYEYFGNGRWLDWSSCAKTKGIVSDGAFLNDRSFD